MALDISCINQNDNLAAQAPTSDDKGSNGSPAAPAAPPFETGNDDLRSQLAAANAQIAALRAERDREGIEHDSALAEQRLKTAAAQAHKPTAKLGTVAQNIAFDKAIQAVGGLAYWSRLTLEQKAAAVGIVGTDTKVPVIKQYFGPGSSGSAAQQLSVQNPAEYLRLKGLAKLHGIVG